MSIEVIVHVIEKYQITMQQSNPYVRREQKVNENKVSSFCETLRYMLIHEYKHVYL